MLACPHFSLVRKKGIGVNYTNEQQHNSAEERVIDGWTVQPAALWKDPLWHVVFNTNGLCQQKKIRPSLATDRNEYIDSEGLGKKVIKTFERNPLLNINTVVYR